MTMPSLFPTCTPLYLSQHLAVCEEFIGRSLADFYRVEAPKEIVALVEGGAEGTTAMELFVKQALAQQYPAAAMQSLSIRNRDGQHTARDLILATCLRGLPSLGTPDCTANREVRIMLCSILARISHKHTNVAVQLASGFADCQQVQYRTISTVYSDICSSPSFVLRVAQLTDVVKRRWLHRLIIAGGKSGNTLDPHVESAYIAAIGDTFGLAETIIAKHDALKPTWSVSSTDQLIESYRQLMEAEDIVQTVYDDMTTGVSSSLSEEECAKQADLAAELKRHSLYCADAYDENGRITLGALVALLIRLGVIRETVSAATTCVIENSLETEGDCEYYYDDDDDNCSPSGSEVEAEAETTNIISHTTEDGLTLVLLPNSITDTYSVVVRGTPPNSAALLQQTAILVVRESNIRPSTCVLSDDIDYCIAAILNKYSTIRAQCPICQTPHIIPVDTVMPCLNENCLEYFMERGLGRDISAEIMRDTAAVELAIVMTWWATTLAPTDAIRDLNFTPFPLAFFKDGVRQYAALLAALERLPAVSVLRDMADSCLFDAFFHDDVYLRESRYLLHWIINSNRTRVELIPNHCMTTDELNIVHDSGLSCLLFRILNAPEKEASFLTHGSDIERVFHGSSCSSWHAIVRNSLAVLSGTNRQINGAVYGPGIYLTTSLATAIGYSTKNASSAASKWPQQTLNITHCVYVADKIVSTASQPSNAPADFRVEPDCTKVIGRYLLCLCQ